MIIKVLLLFGLAACLAYAVLQRHRSRLVSGALTVTSLIGAYFVLFPDHSSRVAQFVGVGRGTDLIVYCWILISLVISVNLQFRIVDLQVQLTELARELAIRSAHPPIQTLDKRTTAGGSTR
jgi:hypothetical protein